MFKKLKIILLTTLLSVNILNAKNIQETKVNTVEMKMEKKQEKIESQEQTKKEQTKKNIEKEKNEDSEIVKGFIKVKDTVVESVETAIGVLIIITLSVIKDS